MSGQREALLLQARDQHIRVLETELAELQADHTERGLVVTMAEEICSTPTSRNSSPAACSAARVAGLLRDHLDRNLLIEEHTDSSAPYDYNLALLRSAAPNALRDFLITQGVEPTRIGAYGYGEQLPIATNETAVGRQANRRVELVILDAGRTMSPRPSLFGRSYVYRFAPRYPEHVAGALVVEIAGEHEQMVRQAVEVLDRDRADRLA